MTEGKQRPPLPLLSNPPLLAGAPARFGSENVLRALGACKTGEVISLNLDLSDPTAPFGRSGLSRSVRLHNDLRPLVGSPGSYVVINDDEVSFALQGSSQWDSLAHFGVIEPGSEGVYFDGAPLSTTYPVQDGGHLGIQSMGPAIISRGVLIDAVADIEAGDFLPADARIDRKALERCVDRQGVELLPGDVVLLYTGFERRRQSLGGGWPTESAGLAPDTGPYLADRKILALASDNPGIDVVPGDLALHVSLLRGEGIPLGELWALDGLAQACRSDDRWEFLLASVPLNIPGAFGSTANAVAVR